MWHRDFFIIALFFTLAIGCTAQPPIVSDPPQHQRAASEQIPWEEEYSRAMMRPDMDKDSAASDVHHDQKFNGPQEQEKESGALGVVADVIAFPFRAIGWLFQSVF